MTKLDTRYREAADHIKSGRLHVAEEILVESTDAAPRAAQSVYLLGVTILLRRRFAEARLLLDRAFAIKPWLKDLPYDVADLTDVVDEALQFDPTWQWAQYERERRRFGGLGFTLANAVAHGLNRADVSFVQVGANDGLSGDPIHDFITAYGWRGVFVEPMPETFERLRANYRDDPRFDFINAAITDVRGPVPLLVGAGDKSTLATLTPDRNALSRDRVGLVEHTVEGITFDEMLDRADLQRFDLLQIDTEGYDYRVLRQVDLRRRGPRVVHIEFYCLPLEERLAAFRQLTEAGYAYRFLGRDLLAVDRAHYDEPLCIVDRLVS
jgi:FkbM family methyltransferase